MIPISTILVQTHLSSNSLFKEPLFAALTQLALAQLAKVIVNNSLYSRLRQLEVRAIPNYHNDGTGSMIANTYLFKLIIGVAELHVCPRVFEWIVVSPLVRELNCLLLYRPIRKYSICG